ncbi:hypothetical protein Tco_0909990 [Tanacetum coccineum]|uniref:Uncharacterized protein n=1 Tax=Tanacetum coccineum TaxID=301880 RepID=A0ABQ5CRJ6_9ASTR
MDFTTEVSPLKSRRSSMTRLANRFEDPDAAIEKEISRKTKNPNWKCRGFIIEEMMRKEYLQTGNLEQNDYDLEDERTWIVSIC